MLQTMGRNQPGKRILSALACALVSLSALGIAAEGCNAILGNRELQFEPDAAAGDTGPNEVDGAHAGDGSPDATVTADAPADAPSDAGCQKSVSSDPANCGACGHSCLGGACEGGACQPFAINVDASCPRLLLASAPPSLYWADNCAQQIVQCNHPPGCVPTIPMALASGQVLGLAAPGGSVYWTDNGGGGGEVSYCNSTGCTPNPAVLASMQVGANGIAVDGITVYWTLNSVTGGVVYDDIALGTQGTIPNRPVAQKIVALGNWVAWIELAGVFVCPLEMPCTSPTMLSSSFAFDIAAGGTGSLVWGDPAGLHTCKLPCSMGPAGLLYDAGSPRAVLADDMYAYWMDSAFGGSPGDLYRCPFAGCGPGGPELVVRNAGPVFAIDPTAIYWSTGATINMLAK
jgi:hypothetical protein